MPVVRLAHVTVAAAAVLAGAWTTVVAIPAMASDPSVDQLQAQLSQSRAHLQSLYADAAAAGRDFDSANRQLADADRAVARERKAVRSARAQMADQSAAVAALTVQQLQSQSGVQRFSSLLHSDGPEELLRRASAYDSAAEAMTSRVDELQARATVHQAAQHRFEEAQDAQRAALAQLASRRATINAAIARSQAATQAAEAERDRLLREFAAQQHESVETVTERQNAIDEQAELTTPQPGEGSPNPAPEPESPSEQPPVQAPPDVSEQPPTDESAPPEPYGVWDKIAKCESGGNWHINTGNGYYGGLQFSARTWHSVGGPGLPHEYSREVQIKYAKILQARSGWGQWSCAGARH